MTRFFTHRLREQNQRHPGGTAWTIAGFVVAVAVLFATPGLTADWLAPAADQTVTAPWVKDLTAQVQQDPYRGVFMNALGNSPQALVVRYLNNAAQALQDGNKPLAQSYVDRTIEIFDNGVRRGYYSRADVEPITKMIRTQAGAAIKGEQVATANQTDDRWTGYTNKKPLGLTHEPSRMMSEHSEAKP